MKESVLRFGEKKQHNPGLPTLSTGKYKHLLRLSR